MNANKRCNILTTKHSQYIANLIRAELTAYEIECEIFLEEHNFGTCQYIVLSPQAFKTLPNKFWCFQLEQSTNERWFTERYLKILDSSDAILDYSIWNIQFLQDKGIAYQKIYYCPLDVSETTAQPKPIENKIYDVLFYGDPSCDRRQRFLKAISNEFNLIVPSNKFGEDLYPLIHQSKVIANIHFYEKSLLETTRINECLSLGAVVVSETSNDQAHHEVLTEAVNFTPVDDENAMVRRIRELISSKENYLSSQNAVSKYQEKKPTQFRYFLGRFLLAKKWIDFQTFSARNGDQIRVDKNGTCLSLPETPNRHLGFMEENHRNFSIFNGLRSEKGWIGCGMSYKILAEYAKKQQWQHFVVCEDDVEFKPDFDSNITKILNYLKERKDDWDVFCGIIADVHPETKIKEIDSHSGIQFIHIDKMTSMVFNIYNRSLYKSLSNWDETNEDAFTNTIDRYLEKQKDLRVITTFPFLVGHREDRRSTLWNIENSGYNELIARSSRVFSEKINDFLKNEALYKLTLKQKTDLLASRINASSEAKEELREYLLDYFRQLKEESPNELREAETHLNDILSEGTPQRSFFSPPRAEGEKPRVLLISNLFPSIRHGGGLRMYDFLIELGKTYEIHVFAQFLPWLDAATYDDLKSRGFFLYPTDEKNFTPECLEITLRNCGINQSVPFDIVMLENEADSFFDFSKRIGYMTGFTLMECASRRFFIELENGNKEPETATRIIKKFLSSAAREARAFQKCNVCFCVTSEDLTFSQSMYQGKAVSSVIETGISTSRFMLEAEADFCSNRSVLFVGNFLHTPNIDGLRWYLNEIHPAMKSDFPEYRLRVIGNGPANEIFRQYNSDSTVEIIGWVDDLEKEILNARVCIAPVISGAGIRGKIIQYSAIGVPTVTTALGAEGLDPLVSTGAILVSKGTSEFIQNLKFAYSNPESFRNRARKLKKRTRDLYDPSKLVEKMLNVYNEVRLNK